MSGEINLLLAGWVRQIAARDAWKLVTLTGTNRHRQKVRFSLSSDLSQIYIALTGCVMLVLALK